MLYKLVFIRCFELPGGSLVKNLPAVQELQDTGVPSLGWRAWHPLQVEEPLEEGVAPSPVFWPGESHGRRSLGGYSPRGHKGSDTTEWLSVHAFKCCLGSARYKDTAPVWPDLSPGLSISVKLKFWDTERESIERGSHCPLYLLLGTLNSDRFQLSAQWPWLSKVSTSKTVVHSVSGTLRI